LVSTSDKYFGKSRGKSLSKSFDNKSNYWCELTPNREICPILARVNNSQSTGKLRSDSIPTNAFDLIFSISLDLVFDTTRDLIETVFR
jgi:hypothetical protein